jgi:hypothetical protein
MGAMGPSYALRNGMVCGLAVGVASAWGLLRHGHHPLLALGAGAAAFVSITFAFDRMSAPRRNAVLDAHLEEEMARYAPERWKPSAETPEALLRFEIFFFGGIRWGQLAIRNRSSVPLDIAGVGYVEAMSTDEPYRGEEHEVPVALSRSERAEVRIYTLELEFMREGALARRATWSPRDGDTELETILPPSQSSRSFGPELWDDVAAASFRFDLRRFTDGLDAGAYTVSVRYDPAGLARRDAHWRPPPIDLGSHELVVDPSR